MTDFAKAQLLKYGWTEGKGLGKSENGIKEAIKPELKFNTQGLGHKETEYEWWDSVYDKALKNIVLCKNNSDVSLKVLAKDEFNIASTAAGIKPGNEKKNLHLGAFTKASTLHNGIVVPENPSELSELKDEETKVNVIPKMTDEELFKACGGRTAHKGARHGLNLNGKLARIAEQEQQLLAAHFLKSNDVSSKSTEIKQKKKKKRRKEKLMEVEDCTTALKNIHMSDDDDNAVLPPLGPADEEHKVSKKTNRRRQRKVNDLSHQLTKSCMIDDSIEADDEKSSDTPKSKCKHKKKKGKRKRDEDAIDSDTGDITMNGETVTEPPAKKKSKKKLISSDEAMTTDKNNVFEEGIDVSLDATDASRLHCDKLNSRIRLRKQKKIKRKENKKLERLSDLLAASLSVSAEEVKEKKTKTFLKS
ncbi:hypothetical protein TKK_0001479 [Trichogramma kaykai]|uniref:G patch domain-containing protein 4 n=1 Tax=Trichogramma kaykai TaxID=54128 RepID=A0ABD2X172_9HYME